MMGIHYSGFCLNLFTALGVLLVIFALVADIHSNLEALAAVLEHARAQGAERFVFLGDLVGYGADPVPVVERIAQLADEGAVVLLGNHDAAVAKRDAGAMNE